MAKDNKVSNRKDASVGSPSAKKESKIAKIVKKEKAVKKIPLPDERKPKKESRLKIPKLRAEKKKDDVQTSDPYEVLRFVLMTEKSVRMVEAQNKLVFIVDRRYDKKEIKKAAETAFESAIESVNTSIDQKGRKKAYIRFVKPGQAGDIAVRLGII